MTVIYFRIFFYVENGLSLTVLPGVQFGLENSVLEVCKFYWFLMQFGETIGSWLVAVLSAERVFALFLPLQHRVLSQKRFSQIVVLSVLVASLVMTAPSIFFTTIRPIYGYHSSHCWPNLTGDSWPVMVFFMMFSVLNVYFCPQLLYSVCTLLLVIKLFSLSRNSYLLGSTTSNNSLVNRPSRKERSSAMTIVLLLLTDIGIGTPMTFFFSVYFVEQVGNPNSLLLQAFLLTLVYLFYTLTLIKRLSNFYIYLLRLKAFRLKLFCNKL